VKTQREFEEQFDELNPQNVVMIQCVGSREDEAPRTYCSRICCTVAIKNSIRIKERNPDANVFVLYKDIRTYGDLEELYLEARELGTIFIRYTDEQEPIVDTDGSVTVFDSMLGVNLKIKPDLTLLSVPLVPKPNKELSQMFKVPRGADSFFLEAHVKLRPIDFATDGIFLAGTGHYPKFTTESIFQGSGAAVRVMALLAKGYILSEGAIAYVNEDMCRGCGRCEEICPFKAIELEVKSIQMETRSLDTVKAHVNQAVCKGCGICIVTCPVNAITIKHFPDKLIEDQFTSILHKPGVVEQVEAETPPMGAP
jgi:heterodisulfide reductase subunit A